MAAAATAAAVVVVATAVVGAAMAPGAPEVGAEVGAEGEGGTAEAPAGRRMAGGWPEASW